MTVSRVTAVRCRRCQSAFLPGRSDTVFCSNGCRQAAYRIRVWLKAETEWRESMTWALIRWGPSSGRA